MISTCSKPMRLRSSATTFAAFTTSALCSSAVLTLGMRSRSFSSLRKRSWFSRAYEIAEDAIKKLLVGKANREPAKGKVYPTVKMQSVPFPLKILIFMKMAGICAQLLKSKNLGVNIRGKDLELEDGPRFWPVGCRKFSGDRSSLSGGQRRASRKCIHRNPAKRGLVVQPNN